MDHATRSAHQMCGRTLPWTHTTWISTRGTAHTNRPSVVEPMERPFPSVGKAMRFPIRALFPELHDHCSQNREHGKECRRKRDEGRHTCGDREEGPQRPPERDVQIH